MLSSSVRYGMKLDLEKYNPFANRNEIVGSNAFSTLRKMTL